MVKTGCIAVGVIANNRKARRNYYIEDKVEAGLELQGTEVKSLRLGQATIAEAYASPERGQLYLLNSYIAPYEAASHFSHDTRRKRKLLLHKREIARLLMAVNRKGMTVIPLSLYFNNRGIAKVELGVARGKTKIDRRETEKERDWQRQKARVLRDKG